MKVMDEEEDDDFLMIIFRRVSFQFNILRSVSFRLDPIFSICPEPQGLFIEWLFQAIPYI